MGNLKKLKIPFLLYFKFKREGKKKKVQDIKAYALSQAYKRSRRK